MLAVGLQYVWLLNFSMHYLNFPHLYMPTVLPKTKLIVAESDTARQQMQLFSFSFDCEKLKQIKFVSVLVKND